MGQELHNNVKSITALTIQTINSDTTTTGAIIDTNGFESLEFAIISGTLTDGAYTASVQQGDESDLSDVAAVPAAEILGSVSFALADDDTTKRIGSVGKKRYQRLTITSTSTSSGGVFTAAGILSDPHRAPVAAEA